MEKKGSGSRRAGSGSGTRPRVQPKGSSAGYGAREEKRALFAQSGGKRPVARKKNNTSIYIVVGVVAAVVVIGFFFMQSRAGTASADPGANLRHAAGVFTAINPDNGVFRLDQTTFDDRKAHFYTYKTPEGKDIDFFVLRSSDGVIRAAIDACDVCFANRKGYHEEGDEMVCNNCGQRFPSAKINEVKGGCNPAPLTRTMDGTTVVISVSDIIKDNVSQTNQPLF